MGQGPLGANWGDGFGTDPEAVTILQQSGLPQSDPNPFFQKLMVCASYAPDSHVHGCSEYAVVRIRTMLATMSACHSALLHQSASHEIPMAGLSSQIACMRFILRYSFAVTGLLQCCYAAHPPLEALASTPPMCHAVKVMQWSPILSVQAWPQVSPYLNNVILSPHIYPPSVTNAPSNYSGAGLNYRLSRSFGSKMKEACMLFAAMHKSAVSGACRPAAALWAVFAT